LLRIAKFKGKIIDELVSSQSPINLSSSKSPALQPDGSTQTAQNSIMQRNPEPVEFGTIAKILSKNVF
jgi:hypothetical protein